MNILFKLIYLFVANDGFVGCIRDLVINSEDVDAIQLLQDHSSVYGVLKDGCNLISHCDGGPHCEHGGKCLSDWAGITCDCRNTAYEGKACHFCMYYIRSKFSSIALWNHNSFP